MSVKDIFTSTRGGTITINIKADTHTSIICHDDGVGIG